MGWFDDPKLDAIDRKLSRLTNQVAELKLMLSSIVAQERKIMDDLEKVIADAEANAQKEADAEVAIVQLVTDLAKMVADLKNTAPQIPAATLNRIQALSDAMKARAEAMATKVFENTEHE